MIRVGTVGSRAGTISSPVDPCWVAREAGSEPGRRVGRRGAAGCAEPTRPASRAGWPLRPARPRLWEGSAAGCWHRPGRVNASLRGSPWGTVAKRDGKKKSNQRVAQPSLRCVRGRSRPLCSLRRGPRPWTGELRPGGRLRPRPAQVPGARLARLPAPPGRAPRAAESPALLFSLAKHNCVIGDNEFNPHQRALGSPGS